MTVFFVESYCFALYFAHLFVPLRLRSKVLALTVVFLLLARHNMQASSACVSFVGSEMLK